MTFSKVNGKTRFGTDGLLVSFSEQGWPESVSVNGETILQEKPGDHSLGFDIQEDKRWASQNEKMTGSSIFRVNESTVCSRIHLGTWQVDAFLQLYPEKKMIRHWFTLNWTADSPGKIRSFWFRNGRMPFVGKQGGYRALALYPPRGKKAGDVKKGGKAWSGQSPSPVLAENGAGWTAFWAQDELRPYADRGQAEIIEEDGAIHVRQIYQTKGHVKKGVEQTVGDSWLWLQKTDGETALKQLPRWFEQVGQLPPKDRPAWLKRVILYSMHPGGTIGSNCQDWGGFSEASKYLSTIDAIGCNAIWLMPLEDKSIYWPRDYYKLQEGIGTPEDYKAFSAKAHGLGMKLWQDCVPHGGCNQYPRALRHPEWLAYNEDGSTLFYWCFDFNWPSWIQYMSDVVTFYTGTYQLDGFRIDAVSGSHIPNWNKDIPYARAGFAQSQGGIAMQRALRKAVKAVNPQGANLAETGDSVHGAVSDATYDFSLCYGVLHDFYRSPAGEFVSNLRRWLHEQQYSQIPDLIRMRHVESHDSLRSSLWYGQAAQEATVALISWIHGFPIVYQEMEDGHFEAYRKIFHLRRHVAELNMGTANYLSVSAPDSVFACLRTACIPRKGEASWCPEYAWDAKSARGDCGTSIVLINFDGKPVSGKVTIPWGESYRTSCSARDLMTNEKIEVKECGSFNISLPPFGYTVIRLESGALPALSPAVFSGTPASVVTASGKERPEFFVELRTREGKRLPVPCTVENVKGKNRFRIGVSGLAGNKPENVMLTVRIPSADRWFAHTAEGGFESPFRVRHPLYRGIVGPIYRLKQGNNCFWDSRLHPFGFEKGTREVGATQGETALVFSGIPESVDVRLLDRLEDEHGFCAAFCSAGTNGFSVLMETAAMKDVLTQTSAHTGDSRLLPTGGGWMFDNGVLRVRFQRNGALRGIWLKKNGAWEKRLEDAFAYTDVGYDKNKKYEQSSDVETFARFTRQSDGRLSLAFEGELRDRNRFAKMSRPIGFRSVYTLGDGAKMDIDFSCRLTSLPLKKNGFLSLKLHFPDVETASFSDVAGKCRDAARPGKGRYLETRLNRHDALPSKISLSGKGGPTLRFSAIRWQGCPPENVFLDGKDLHFAWLDGAVTAIKEKVWQGFSASLTVE